MLDRVMGWTRIGAFGALLAAFFLLAACDDADGPAEEAGEKVDEAMEDATD